MSPLTHDLEYAVRAYVAAGCGLSPDSGVLKGNAHGPAPEDLYATVLLIQANRLGIDPVVLTPDPQDDRDVQATVLGALWATYSVQWFRSGARDAAMRFAQWASSPLGHLDAAQRGLTYQRCSAVRQLNDIVSEEWEERAGLDLTLSYTQRTDQPIGTIQTVPLTAAVSDGPQENTEVTKHGT